MTNIKWVLTIGRFPDFIIVGQAFWNFNLAVIAGGVQPLISLNMYCGTSCLVTSGESRLLPKSKVKLRMRVYNHNGYKWLVYCIAQNFDVGKILTDLMLSYSSQYFPRPTSKWSQSVSISPVKTLRYTVSVADQALRTLDSIGSWRYTVWVKILTVKVWMR